VQKTKSYTIINFDNENILEFNDGINSDIVVSNRNGLLIAVGTERFVNIYTNPDVFVNTFTMPLDNEKLISLSFSPNDNLMVFTDLNNVYVLSPTPCPNTYISDNLKCICPDTYVEDSNKCICSVNYIETNSRCICPDSFIEQSQKCFCMNELFAIDGACRLCSFPCKSCEGTTSTCIEYAESFYILIGSGALVIIAVIIVIVFIKKRKNRKAKE
jgi:hypothetical protein